MAPSNTAQNTRKWQRAVDPVHSHNSHYEPGVGHASNPFLLRNVYQLQSTTTGYTDADQPRNTRP